MSEKIQAVRGMQDILPSESIYFDVVEAVCRQVVTQYAYEEIRLPVVEKTQLFKRSIGDATDIVEKEMYTFDDRNGDSLTLRPEGTAGCVRAGIERGLLYNQVQRLWYLGPMFRHERPQKGRYRQFQQLGVEVFGLSSPQVDAELIALSKRFWDELGLAEHVRLEINTLGTSEQRQAYRDALVAYLKVHQDQLDQDSVRRLESNPLRILDSKNPETQAVIANAPKLDEFVEGDAKKHFETLCQLLDAIEIKYIINPYLVRGLDYYGSTVFEWVTDALGAQGTVCAGGRYDGLVEQLGGKATPAVGFAMGVDRVALLLESMVPVDNAPDVYVTAVGGVNVSLVSMRLSEMLRDQCPNLCVLSDNSDGSFKSQLKRADKSGAQYAVIIGESEVDNQVVTLKHLRDATPQETMDIDELLSRLSGLNDQDDVTAEAIHTTM